MQVGDIITWLAGMDDLPREGIVKIISNNYVTVHLLQLNRKSCLGENEEFVMVGKKHASVIDKATELEKLIYGIDDMPKV